MTSCSVPDCDRVITAKGLCYIHYGRKRRHGDPLATPKPRRRRSGMTYTKRPAEQRFWAKVDKNGPLDPGQDSPCWLWTNRLSETTGYGYFSIDGASMSAHRAAYILFVGPVTPTQRIDHWCSTRACVNPDHLRLLSMGPTPRDVMERFWAKVNKNGSLQSSMESRCWEWTAYINPDGYGQFSPSTGTNDSAYAFLWKQENGPVPAGLELDHRCRNTLCVNPTHLRAIPTKQNGENRDPLSGRGSSRYRGVAWDKESKKWEVTVTHYGKAYRGGRFVNEDDAGEAARLLRNQLYTHNDADRVG